MAGDKLQTAAIRLARAQRIVCLTGAGASAESGIATFRDAQTGQWAREDPMRLASPEGFAANPGLVWRWYMARLRDLEKARPNAGHVALAQLAAHALEFTLVTQNVDDLHERAGSPNVLHLHGRIGRFRCHRCGEPHTLTDADRKATEPPQCTACRGPVRPAVVWFGEMLPGAVVDQAQAAAQGCDVMLVVGTSGVVYPAASMPWLAHEAGATLIEVNSEPTPFSRQAIFLAGPSGVVLPELVAASANRWAEGWQR